MQRRAFNTYLSGLLLCASAPSIASAAPSRYKHWYASASVDADEQHWLVVFNEQGIQKMRHALPSRAHQVLKHPIEPWVLVVARRPGQYLLVIDLPSGELIKHISADSAQHFCGHLQVSASGQYLYTTENISHSSQGLVVVRDIYQDWAKVSQFSSGGIGPHQLKLNAAQDTIVVANGGIHTQGREKLNVESMQPNLSYINLHSQKIEQSINLRDEYAQLSIRHIDVSASGQVLIAMQYQGERTALVPLVALHKRGQPLVFLAIADNDYFSLQHYCGSSCFDRAEQTVAVSAPKGDSILFWDVLSRRYLGKVTVRDGCGLAVGEGANEFIVSSGRGRVYRYNPRTKRKTLISNDPALQWDNHLAAI